MRPLTDLTAFIDPLPLARRVSNLLTGWRGLGRFWATVVVLLILTAATLQTLGPATRRQPMPLHATDTHGATHEQPGHAEPHHNGHDAVGRMTPKGPAVPGRAVPGPISDPDPTLLEPYAGGPGQKLPRTGADGSVPMAVYAAGFDPANVKPRVGIVIDGVGLSESDSLNAIKSLPGAVTLAVSPYAADLTRLLAAARGAEHEYLLEIPMEPQGYPVNDPDDRYALMTSLSPTENLNRLRAIMVRLTGYVGVTNAMGQMHGERLAAMVDQFDTVLEEVGQRGLLFIDARPNEPLLGRAWNRSADILLDAGQVNASVLDQRLDALTHLALDKGSALGLVSVPRPVAVERVAAWTNTLAAKGVVLAPVSALVQRPAKQDFEK